MGTRRLLLFDVDGTLTAPMGIISQRLLSFLLESAKPVATLGLVGGSDYAKISRQMGGDSVVAEFEYAFCENGLVRYERGVHAESRSMIEELGEPLCQRFVNFCLRYMSEIELPAKRGNFVEFRTGVLNVSPIGRACSQRERDQFAGYDREHRVRERFVEAMRREFPDAGMQFAIGGQISIDVFPKGWDKTYCLRHVDGRYDEIHFFGDKTFPGGNDHEIYEHPSTHGHSVESPEDTERQLRALLKLERCENDS